MLEGGTTPDPEFVRLSGLASQINNDLRFSEV